MHVDVFTTSMFEFELFIEISCACLLFISPNVLKTKRESRAHTLRVVRVGHTPRKVRDVGCTVCTSVGMSYFEGFYRALLARAMDFD